MNIAGVDPGRFKVKVWCDNGHFDFFSNLGEYRELEFKDVKGKDDLLGEYRRRKFTAGTLARRESEFGDSLMIDSKLHEDTVILVLIALHKAFESGEVRLVTGLPVDVHERDKKELKQLLDGYHHIEINGERKTFSIRCEVAPEGCGIYKYSGPGTVRGLNIGSRTVNAITFKDKEKIGKESDTFDFGMESGKSRDYSAMARAIAAKTGALKWKREDKIYICGGGAITLYNELLKYYPNTRLTMNPVYTDAEAFYQIARDIYGKVHP